MSESLITDRSRAFRSDDGCLLPFAWLQEGEEDPKHRRVLGVPGSIGGDGYLTGLGWRWVPVPPDQPDPESIIIQKG